jgi:hypothetical protein
MAKHSARDASFYLDDNTGACKALSGDFNTVTVNWTSEQVDVTGFGSPTHERVHEVLNDYTISVAGFWNNAADHVQDVLVGSAAGIGIGGSTYFQFGPAGSATGSRKYCGSVILTDCSIEATNTGAVTATLTLIARTGCLAASVW